MESIRVARQPEGWPKWIATYGPSHEVGESPAIAVRKLRKSYRRIFGKAIPATTRIEKVSHNEVWKG